MKKIWEFFENMNELVYVSDVDSYELIYMNKKVLEVYGFVPWRKLPGKNVMRCFRIDQSPV